MPLSRKKSCVRCRHAKARCDLSLPACSRCRLRNHDCAYEGESRVSPLPWLSTTEYGSALLHSDATSSDTALASTIMLDAPIDIDWLHEDIGFAQALKLFEPPSRTMPFDQNTANALATLDGGHILPSPHVPDNLPVPITSTSCETGQVQQLSPQHRGTLQRRRILKHCVLSSVIVGQMTSYPKMMIEGDTLPPFISPPCFSRGDMAPDCAESGYHRCLPQDLSICQS